MINTYNSEFVSQLAPNQVFVMTTNLQGFHGAGNAGYASFGAGITWREADYGIKPNGWKGRWNVKGIGEGYQEGTEGRSYALPTVVKAGYVLSLKPSEIVSNICRFYSFAESRMDLEFLVAGSFKGRLLNGYDHKNMIEMYYDAGPIPSNVLFSKTYADALNKLLEVDLLSS